MILLQPIELLQGCTHLHHCLRSFRPLLHFACLLQHQLAVGCSVACITSDSLAEIYADGPKYSPGCPTGAQRTGSKEQSHVTAGLPVHSKLFIFCSLAAMRGPSTGRCPLLLWRRAFCLACPLLFLSLILCDRQTDLRGSPFCSRPHRTHRFHSRPKQHLVSHLVTRRRRH